MDALERILLNTPDSGALAGFFRDLPATDLSRFWPACVAESLSVDGRTPRGLIGNLMRSLVVVSERITGVRYVTEVRMTQKAESLMRAGMDANGEVVVDGVVRREGPMPAAKSRSHADPVIDSMSSLKGGHWLEFKKAVMGKQTLRNKIAKARKVNKNLDMYETDDGRYIVYIGAPRK